MPIVGNKKFPYTKQGEKDAKAYSKKTNQSIVYKNKYSHGGGIGSGLKQIWRTITTGENKEDYDRRMREEIRKNKKKKEDERKKQEHEKKKESKKYEEGGTNDIQKHQSPGFQTMFEVGSKMNLFGKGGPASEKAKMRHERKMGRQQARSDRKMVKTEGRQERRGDRLTGRQETRSRMQDRKDKRLDSRLGYYKDGGKPKKVRIKRKDRPTGRETSEYAYEKEHGVPYMDDPNLTRDLPDTITSERKATPKKSGYYQAHKKDKKGKPGELKKNIFGKIKHKRDRIKKKNLRGRTVIYGDTLERQDSRKTADIAGHALRTQSYDIVDKDGKKKRVHFKNEEDRDRYFKNIDKDTGNVKREIVDVKDPKDEITHSRDEEGRKIATIKEGDEQKMLDTDISDFKSKDRYYDKESGTWKKHSEDKAQELIKSLDRHTPYQPMTPKRKKELEKEVRQDQFDKEQGFEDDIRALVKDSPQTGITGKHSKLDFSGQEFSNIKNPKKYEHQKTKYVFNPKTGMTTEKVKRKGPAGWVGGYKKTGRELADEDYIATSEEKKKRRQEEEAKKPSRKETRQQNKEDKKEKKEEKNKQSEVARKAKEEGKSSYIYNGVEYKFAPKVMKGGGTLMSRYNRKYATGGLDLGEIHDPLKFDDAETEEAEEINTTQPNDNQLSINGDNLGDTTNNAINEGNQEVADMVMDNNLNQQDDSMDQQDDTQEQDPAGPTRAQLRHERKSSRQQARADRRMVRTQGRQQRKADRLAGRMEKRGRRQDRKDLRQEARIDKREDRRSERQQRRANRRGNFHKGGMVKGKKGAGLGIIIMVGRKSNKKGK